LGTFPRNGFVTLARTGQPRPKTAFFEEIKMPQHVLSTAIRHALRAWPLAGTSLACLVAVPAAAQNAAPAADNAKSQNLETIVVTGSNIRRVDMETANPVLTIDHAAIEKSGKVTLGDLIQQLPSMAGNAMNPNVNNGGGTGASTISLRGLGTQRSLLLINGHRVPFQLQDLNIIPASAVERIEVLSDGSSAVYGSDAVAGVVNIITRNNYQGAEIGVDYGISDHDDGQRRAVHAMFGQSTDKGSILLGINYNKTDSVLAANRAYSHDALYKYNTGYVVHGGSSRTPNGAISLPASILGGAPFNGCKGIAGNGGRVTRKDGTTGTSLSDYRCYNGQQDAFNYQAVGNYDQTPSERTGLFALGNYKITDNVEAFMEIFHNKTVSRTQIAPVPLDAQQDNLFIPTNQYYNPFGVAFGNAPDGSQQYNEFKTRLSSLGPRQTNFSTTHDLVTAGFKGSFADSSWTWFADASYGKVTQHGENANYINYSRLTSNFACTQASCNPINIFNIYDPNTISLLQSAKTSYKNSPLNYQMKSAEFGVSSSSLFSLPAGDVGFAAGASYRKEYVDSVADAQLVSQITRDAAGNIASISCSGPSSICTANTQGGYNVKEAYAELLVPILKDQPFVHSLNLTLGDRYSKYSNFGSTNNWKVAIELKPIEDLLLRATVSKVFRAPSVTDLFAGPSADSATATDPCGPTSVASNPACQGYVFQNTGTSQTNGIVNGSVYSNSAFGTKINLQPEHGKSFDYGFVYDPNWLPGLSVSADYYRIVLDNLIVSGPGIAQTILTSCYYGVQETCQLITRNTSGSSYGQIKYIYESSFNAGTLVTEGADVNLRYRLPETSFGNFTANFQTTYIQKYDITTGLKQGFAGHFDRTYGNLVRWRALAGLDWNWGAFNANWTARYIGRGRIGYACNGASAAAGDAAGADGCYPHPENAILKFGAYTYHNISVGYNIEPLNTMIQVGVDNVGNKQPPIFYQENVANANTDVNTYDTVGRYFFGKITVKF
jgi:outer membrane receptor protein involved in Fe transport